MMLANTAPNLEVVKNDVPEGKLRVVKIQRTCVHDGPGIRTTVFFRGCGLRCLWCQNPETLSAISDPKDDCNYTLAEIAEIVSRDKLYYDSTGGGVTFSGGDPLLQHSESMVALMKLLTEQGIKISVETSLHVPWKNIEAVLPYVSLFLVDFKVVGDDALHMKLTTKDSVLIHENLKKLLANNANIRFRMVMVPGWNDAEENIKAAAEYLKSIGYSFVELLKYHNMYEDKAKRLGLEIPMLGITPDQALASLKKGMEFFGKYGISTYNDDLAERPPKAQFSERVLKVQQAIREAPRGVCFEVGGLKTEYYKKHKGFKKPTPIHRSERLKYVLERKTTKIYPDELLVGNFTSKRVGGQVWEEQYGILYISFLYKVNKQTPVPFQCSFKERMKFYFKIFPYWLNKGVMIRGHKNLRDLFLTISRVAETVAGFNNNFAAIAHYIPNYDRLLELGTTGLKAEVKQAMKDHPENNQDFYSGVLTALEGLEILAERYAKYLAETAKEEKDPARKAELLRLSEICEWVPKNPARGFYEALQSITLMHIALCTEAYENAISFGRFDQLLYPYYKKDFDEGKITYDEAKELLALFIMKMDEVILVNDGDGLLNVGKLFETLSVDQALTFGGCDRDGNDATNDLTYMLIDICELQPLAVNMCARINANSPQKYLDRLAEIYINGCPMPELFSDNIYIDSIPKHYDTSIENARNYSIVGCVEPVASDNHFGNTDCSNVNLALPLLDAVKGQSREYWRFGFPQQMEKLITRVMEFMFKKDKPLNKKIMQSRYKHVQKYEKRRGWFRFDPPANMDELLTRYQARLNYRTKEILTAHQRIEKALREHYTTPLASSLYKDCIDSGKDCYEGGTHFNSSGIQAVGVTDVADSLYAIDELVFKQKKYTMMEMIKAIDSNFEGIRAGQIRDDIKKLPKFGDDSSDIPSEWVSWVMGSWNSALDSVPNVPRNGYYSAGYYALNVSDRYGKKTQALPSGRLAGTPLANSVAPAYEFDNADLISACNAVSKVNFTDYAVNGTTLTFTIDTALFPGESGVNNLANIFRTYLTTGGMQFQPNIVSKELLLEAYHNPEKHKYLMVRVAGYCAYFQELSDELKQIIINRTCYS